MFKKYALSSVVIASNGNVVDFGVDTNSDTEESSASHNDGVSDAKGSTYSRASDTQTRSQHRMPDRWPEDLSSGDVLEVILRRLWKKLSRTTVGESILKVSFFKSGFHRAYS